MIYKRCTRCHKRIPEGETCECNKGRNKEYDKYGRDKGADVFYHSKDWNIVRKKVLALDEVDVYIYMTDHRIVIPDTVHHIEPLRDNFIRRLDIDNLMSLHHDTHSFIEQRYRKDKAGMIKLLTTMVKQYRNMT